MAAVGLALLLPWGLAAIKANAQERIQITIESQPLGQSINELARQTGLQVVLFDEVGAGITAPSLQGEYTPQMALQALLANTGLQYEYIGERTYAIHAGKPKENN